MSARTVFADTSFYLAIMRSDDPVHSPAVAEAEIDRTIVATEFVILELGNACSRPSDRTDFLIMVQGLRASRRIEIVPLDSDLLERGLRRMSDRPDKSWSLTDCISFIVMEEAGIRDALTADHHFEQAGFRALLRTG